MEHRAVDVCLPSEDTCDLRCHIVYHIILKKIHYFHTERKKKKLVQGLVRRCILRQHICTSRHEFVWSAGHFNICAPRLVYQIWAVLVSAILTMQYVSLSPEKQFADVETGQKKATSSHEKSFINFKIFPVLPVEKVAKLAPKSENIS